MATAVEPVESELQAAPDHIVLYDVSWELYEKLLEEVGEQRVFITYSDGSLEIMSPLPAHERWKTILGGCIEILSLELNIPMARLGSTTFRRKKLAKGLEPDECYYIQHERQIRGKDRIDLRRDPPPDLVVEIEITRRAVAREPIYAALGVPELWRFDGLELTASMLGSDGRYQPVERSVAFPFLRMSDLERFLKMLPATDETSMVRAFRDWVKAELSDASRE